MSDTIKLVSNRRYNCLSWAVLRYLRFGGEIFILKWECRSLPHFGWKSGVPCDPFALHWSAEHKNLPIWRQFLPFSGAVAVVWLGEGD